MKILKLVGILALVYVGIVVAFESLIGYLQPEGEGSLVITTTADDGTPHDRVLARLESRGQLYVASNHWPRAWYNRALENPNVQVTLGGEKGNYLAVAASREEHDRVDAENSRGVVFKFLTGFPPRYFLRLEPR